MTWCAQDWGKQAPTVAAASLPEPAWAVEERLRLLLGPSPATV